MILGILIGTLGVLTLSTGMVMVDRLGKKRTKKAYDNGYNKGCEYGYNKGYEIGKKNLGLEKNEIKSGCITPDKLG